jgi:hypothetical protein
MLPSTMAASNTAVRALAFVVFLACAVVVGVGIWYVRTGGIRDDSDDEALVDDEDPGVPRPDGGVYRRAKGGKKKAARRQGKASEVHHAVPAGPAGPVGPSGASYESAIAGNNLQLAPGMKDAPDLTDEQLAGPMRNGTFLDACGVPVTTKVTVKVAIRTGHAVGVSVYASPSSPQLTGCVERRVRNLQWPSNAKMDSFVTTY